MRILVTGAAGFIGSHVAEAYHAAGHDVVGIDDLSNGTPVNLPETVCLHEISILDSQKLERLFREFQPDVLSHHAAQVNLRLSWENPADDARTNILGSLELLHQAVKWKTKKIIYSSSGGAIYGNAPALPVSEECAPRPVSNYGISKYAVELYLHSFHEGSGLRYVIFRYPNVYGSRQEPRGEAGVVAIFTVCLLKGEQPRIFGAGNKTRDYVFITDIVDANLRALDFDGCGVFNLGWGQEISDLKVYHTVRNAVGCKLDPLFDKKRPGEIDRMCLDATRAKHLLGWEPRVRFPEGVQEVVAYWKHKLRCA